MRKKPMRWGLGVLLLFILLLLGGGWWLVQSRALTFDGASLSQVGVTITAPGNGDDVYAGDFVPVLARAVAPETIQSMELFLDGQSLGKLTDKTNASWTWQAWSPGIHSFYAQATDSKGQVGYSQVVIVNVLAGDGMIDVIADGNQTLEQLGAGYGVPSDQMAAANPNLPLSQPLPEGKQAQVPVANFEPPDLSLNDFISVKWKIKVNEPVDKFYCYASLGNGVWEKIPKGAFDYFYGQENFYTQLIPYTAQANIQMQCWGWQGGTLKYLGQGEKLFDPAKTQGEISIDTTGFIFVGVFKMPEIEPLKKLGGNLSVPPPFAVREASTTAECASHGDPIAVPLLCNGVMNAKLKQNIALVWEWKPETCWPGSCKYGVNDIKGYGVYEIDPLQQTTALIADIKSSAMRVAFPPIPWAGGKCFGVEAYADYPGSHVSEMATFCPGKAPATKKVTLTNVTEWLTTEDVLSLGEDCPYTQAHVFKLDKPGFGSQPGQVYIGAAIRDSEGDIGKSACYMDEYYQGGVKFDLESEIPPNALVQKAILRFINLHQVFVAGAVAAPKPGSCVLTVSGSNQSWSGKINADHWISGNMPYGATSVSVNPYMAPQADVTSIVGNWLKKPGSNFGFILRGWFPALPTEEEDTSMCVSAIGSFQLDVYYYPAP